MEAIPSASVRTVKEQRNANLIGTECGIYITVVSGLLEVVKQRYTHLVQQIEFFNTDCVNLVQHEDGRDVNTTGRRIQILARSREDDSRLPVAFDHVNQVF